MMLFRLIALFALFSLTLGANDTTNVLIYGDHVQVTYQINLSAVLTAGAPIPVTVMVTHEKNNPVDVDSFRYGNKPLTAAFVQNVPMPSNADIIVSVYQAQLEGLPAGNQTLQPISAKVGGKPYQSTPVSVMIYPKGNQ
jgi:hypothetical protein